MRTSNWLIHKSLLMGGIIGILTGCDAATSGPTGAPGTSAVALSVEAAGSGSAQLRVTAIDEISGKAESVEHLVVQGGTSSQLVLDLTPSRYTIDVQAFADASEQNQLGEAKAVAEVATNATALVDLTIDVDAIAKGSGGGGIVVEPHAAPVIRGLSVNAQGVGNIGDLGLGGLVLLDKDGNASGKIEGASAVTIQLDAKGAEGEQLHFFWSGVGVVGSASGSGSLEGSASLDLSAQGGALLGVSTRVIHVVVQDSQGAASALRIELDSTLAAGFTAFHASAQAAAGADAQVSDCLASHASCIGSCDAAANGSKDGAGARLSCLSSCGITLSSCESQ